MCTHTLVEALPAAIENSSKKSDRTTFRSVDGSVGAVTCLRCIV
jgi:hypothetical protein